jgi:hypothetical protein
MNIRTDATGPDAAAIGTAISDSDEAGAPLVSFGVLKEAVRRRRRPIIACALAGMVIGAAFHHFVPSKFAATTDLYMVEPPGSDPVLAIANDVSLLQTRAVAEDAIAALHVDAQPTTFLSTYLGTAVSNEIISVRLSAPSPALAVSYENAVTKAFLAVRADELANQTTIVVDGLNAQVAGLNTDITNLTNSINALSGSPAGPGSSSQISQLVDQRGGDASQISQLESQVQQDQLGEKAAVQGSQVLDPAAPVPVSDKKIIAEDSLSGLAGGLGLSLAAVLIAAVVSDRPRRRSDVATVLGAPVELSTGSFPHHVWMRSSHLRWLLRKPNSQIRMIENRLRSQLDSLPGSSLAVVEIEASDPAALGVTTLAMSLASEGKNVVLADFAEGRPLASLLGVRSKAGVPANVSVKGGRDLTVIVAPDDPAELSHAGVPDGTDAVLVLATTSPSTGAEYLSAWASGAVVVLTAGRASSTRIAACGHLLRQSGLAIQSAILVAARPDDETTGSPAHATEPRRVESADTGTVSDHRPLHSGAAEKMNGFRRPLEVERL